ncbi:MAG: HWE histidine kinase domain-containing protein [Pseudomonadota bacterium]
MSGGPTIDAEWNPRHLRLAIDAAGIALWAWNVDTDHFKMDSRGYDLWDVPPQPFVCFEDLSAKIHPADRDRVRAAFAATRALVGSYEIDFRIIVGEDVRWISARGQGDDADIEAKIMYGVFLDVTGRKQAEEGHELLAGEMSHRVKNLLSMATALTSITARSSHSASDMAHELTSRLGALGRAHDLVRPLPGQKVNGSLLGDLLTIVLAPYDELEAAFSGRIRVAVPRMLVGESAATALALVLHELATNSVKYGALSVASGTLDVSATPEEDSIVIVWTETGGPPVAEPAARPGGFGSKLLTRSVTSQLNGSVEHDWRSDGLLVTIRVAKDRLSV